VIWTNLSWFLVPVEGEEMKRGKLNLLNWDRVGRTEEDLRTGVFSSWVHSAHEDQAADKSVVHLNYVHHPSFIYISLSDRLGVAHLMVSH
jgi:hypothetical protein